LAKKAAKPAPKPAADKPKDKQELAEGQPKKHEPASPDEAVVPATHHADVPPEPDEDEK